MHKPLECNLQLLYNFFDMKIAVFTKEQMKNSPIRQNLLSRLKDSGDFDVCEISLQNIEQYSADFDKILVFGGDGSVLEAVHSGIDAPIVGVNLGKLGFLTQFDSDVDYSTLFDALYSNEYDTRMLLDICVGDNKYHALNEAVVKANYSRPVYIDVRVDGKFVDCYHGDGAIVSTPTGSTAYSLSAGGPVLEPKVEAVVINPICAHSLHSRPLVVSSSSTIEFTLNDDNNGYANTQNTDFATLCIDGENLLQIGVNEKICISKSDTMAKFVAISADNFYKKLLEKMNVWGVASAYKG